MASSEKSERLGLSLWEPTDRPERLDFRQDNEILETALGDHLESALKHITADDREFLDRPFSYLYYTGTGASSTSRKIYFSPRAMFVFCLDCPPVVPRSDGKLDIYWDLWFNHSNSSIPKDLGLGGIAITSTGGGINVARYNKTCAKDSNYILHLNDSSKRYLVLLLPERSKNEIV